MNFKNFLGVAGVSLMLIGAGACGDDYVPMQLVSPTDTSVMFTAEKNTLTLYPYSEGVSLKILGGEGRFVIDNSDDKVVSYQYDGETLTLRPEGVGSAVITITDRAGGVFELTVNVNYVTATYDVVSQSAVITGEDMTQGEMAKLTAEIISDMGVAIGGRYEFMFHNEACTEGIATIYPTDSQSGVRYGNFAQKNLFTPDGQEYLATTLNIGSETYEFSMMKNDAGEVTELRRDVTARYKASYPALESAYAVQGVELETEPCNLPE